MRYIKLYESNQFIEISSDVLSHIVDDGFSFFPKENIITICKNNQTVDPYKSRLVEFNVSEIEGSIRELISQLSEISKLEKIIIGYRGLEKKDREISNIHQLRNMKDDILYVEIRFLDK